jgi:hypothetical protein
MNIKTTIVLLVLLLGVGGYLLFTREKPRDDIKPVEHTLLDIKTDDVTRFLITDSDGKQIAGVKTIDGNLPPAWKLTQPVEAPAETYKVSALLDTLTGLKSTAEVPASGTDAPKTGLDKPQYTVDLFVGDKDTKLTVGDALGVSGGVYVRVGGHDQADVVSDSLIDSLNKPANDLRKTQLFETASPSVQQVAIRHKDGSSLVLEKQAKGWQVVTPAVLPADSSAVDDLISSVINMTAVEFVDDPSQAFGLNHPMATFTFSTAAPSTQPATKPSTQLATTAPVMPGGSTVIFGAYDDVLKKNIFVQLPGGQIVKVAASVLDSLNKTPLDLRDKTVVDFDPAQVTKLSVNLDQPATTQPVAAAVTKLVVLERRKKTVVMGPVLPTTHPTSGPGTQPAVPATDWVVAGPPPSDADDTKVTALLGDLHPLKADKFLATAPATKPVKVYTVTLSTSTPGVPAVLVLSDSGNDASLNGSYNGLSFQLPRTILTDLGAEFSKAPLGK